MIDTADLADAEGLVVRALQNAARRSQRRIHRGRARRRGDGWPSRHGLSRVAGYAAQLQAGKIEGHAQPKRSVPAPAPLRIDAKGGFAYPALDLGHRLLCRALRTETGIAAAAIFHSHHIGQAGRTVERLADQGLIALVVSNTPQAMAFHGGKRADAGHQSSGLCRAAPQAGAPLVIDLALSLVARAKIVAAQKAGESIPAGLGDRRATARPPRIPTRRACRRACCPRAAPKARLWR